MVAAAKPRVLIIGAGTRISRDCGSSRACGALAKLKKGSTG